MLHCTWHCTKVKIFCYDLCDALTEILNIPIPLDPGLCLLGNVTNLKLNQNSRKFIAVAESVYHQPGSQIPSNHF